MELSLTLKRDYEYHSSRKNSNWLGPKASVLENFLKVLLQYFPTPPIYKTHKGRPPESCISWPTFVDESRVKPETVSPNQTEYISEIKLNTILWFPNMAIREKIV